MGLKVLKERVKIRNRCNQAQHLTQDTNGKVTTSQLDIADEAYIPVWLVKVEDYVVMGSFLKVRVCVLSSSRKDEIGGSGDWLKVLLWLLPKHNLEKS